MQLLTSLTEITRPDKVKNSITDKLRSENLNDTVTHRQNWGKHVQRMTENRILRQMVDYGLQGVRSSGRPRKTWQDQA
jgi:hypothetical protein